MERSIIEKLGFERAIDISKNRNISVSQKEIINQVNKFGIDKVYFSQNEKNSYPAVFFKKVKSFDVSTLKDIAKIHKKVWNYKKVSFLYVYNDVEIRIYNCIETPIFITDKTDYIKELEKKELKSCKYSDKEQLEKLLHIFSSIAIDSGLIWSIEEAAKIREKIKVQQRVDKYLVESLTEATKKLMDEGLEIKLIHRLILRSLFLLYLEDRGATDQNFYAKIQKTAKSYFDILKNKDDTYSLYKKLEKHFNGNVFSIEIDEEKKLKGKHLAIIRKCFISGYNKNTLQMELFPDWRLFDFGIIPIELISQIYENFLSKIDPNQKKKSGTYYTPPSLVELILNEKLPINSNDKQYELKILDPACGSGIFLVESFKRLVKRYEKAHNLEKLTNFEILKKILTDNIYGIEIDGNAIKVATFSLYLALVDKLEPKTLWQSKEQQLPNLINDPNDMTLKKQGKNLYCRDAIEEIKEIEGITFDLVIGNPPFGTDKLSNSIRKYCDDNQFAKEKVLPFLHKAVKFAPNGDIAMIFNTKLLTNTGSTYRNFKKWLMQECYVEKVYNFSILRKAPKDFGGQLFGDAVGPISIVFYRKEEPKNPTQKIVYYAPKTYVKSNVLEGIVIDSTDVKYLPRKECQKPDTKIWKIAMWGGIADLKLMEKINSKYKILKSVFARKNKQCFFATGLNADSEHLDFVPQTIIDTKKIERYYTPKSACYINSVKYRKIEEQYFKQPFIVIKQAQSEKQIAASYIDYKAYCLSSAYVINGKNITASEKKALVAIFNSAFSKYFFFMLASSWGIERERIQKNEMLLLPYLLDNNIHIEKINNLVDKLMNLKKKEEIFQDISEKSSNIEKNIDSILFNDILKLSKKEQININDVLEYNLDLFEKQQKSKGLLPISNAKPYAEMLCSELNDILEEQSLFANATVYANDMYNPLSIVKISFEKTKKKLVSSEDSINKELKKINEYLWEKKAGNIYFRKKLNYYNGDDIFIIRPNQQRFWSQSMAMEDAAELIIEILNLEAQ
ncbi:MAG: SAM-dependent methyltransferase [Fibromonadaceae bacterium]|jgi:type I restriction-modification system DNA methylase subunit|nr:SAM-dependent methyltransferase [Fibromonadaceae bacterium]